MQNSILLYGKNSIYEFYPFDKRNIIGEGGMGRVFKGIDTRSGKHVAIKAIFAELVQRPSIKERSELEAHLQFKHPNLIEMLDFCVTEEGRIHIISSLVIGKIIPNVTQIISGNTFERNRTISNYIIKVLDALTILHQKGIVHRDVKPDNILIDSNNNPVLMDLGVAKASNGKRLTNAGVIIGTPHYSAPEQIKGEGDRINSTTDIYSTGITLFELLTGSPPFDGSSQFDIMEMQIKKIIPHNDKITNDVFKVLKKATEKEQAKRYQSAQELKSALQKTFTQKTFWEKLFSKNYLIC